MEQFWDNKTLLAGSITTPANSGTVRLDLLHAVHALSKVKAPHAGERIIVFSPHPDDETIAVGGYIYDAVRRGARVWVVLVTDGNRRGLKQKRYAEFQQAMQVLGVSRDMLLFLNHPDGRLERQDVRELATEFGAVIADIQPQVVIGPHAHDRHRDHRSVARVVASLTSAHRIMLYQYLVHYRAYPQPKIFMPESYLVPPHALNEHWEAFWLTPQSLQQKYRALLVYRTQLKNPFLRNLLLAMVRQNEIFAHDPHSST